MWTNKDTAQVLAVATIVLSGIEKALSYFGQQYMGFWEANIIPLNANLFSQVGLLWGHIILFCITIAIAGALTIGAMMVEKVKSNSDRRISGALIVGALVVLTIFQAIVTFHNVLLIVNAA
ncbi:Uncharacterised protein [uncultured archaeon]|nr:Uncharacterised protein [uncultured archaeon]